MSNVVRGAEQVSDSTRRRVQRALERLDYKPNAIARNFVHRRTTILGVLVGDLGNPYYAQMAQTVERAAFGFGYTTMFCNIEGEAEIASAGVDALLEHRVAGIVFLASFARTPELGDALQRADVPIVFLGLSESWGDSVGLRDGAGAVALIDAGEAAGMRVPDHLSVVGFDDIALAGLGRISLTTVAQPLDFQAKRAVSVLLERIAAPNIGPRQIRVPAELRVRESNRRARGSLTLRTASRSDLEVAR